LTLLCRCYVKLEFLYWDEPTYHHLSFSLCSFYEHINLGQEKLHLAVDSSLSDEEAQPLFDKANDHIKDATCSSLIQWGHVHVQRVCLQCHFIYSYA
jgi:hypothetical protein